MNDELKDLKDVWGKARSVHPDQPEVADVVAASESKFQKTQWMHLGTILILTMTLFGLAAFFYFLAPMQDTMSRVGIGLMLGGLLIRIVIEIISRARSSTLNFAGAASKVNEQYRQYHSYRMRIHGPITATILVAYTIGFYLLIPEFSRYFDTMTTWLLGLSYIPAAMIFGFFIRKGILDEKVYLEEILRLQSEFEEEN
jgi:hypothetical protein